MVTIGDKVLVKSGKYNGKVGMFCCWTVKHPLSSSRRGQIRVRGKFNFVTLLVNEENFERCDPNDPRGIPSFP